MRVLSVSSPAMPALGGEPALEPVAIEGDEGLSRLFRYTLTLATPEQPGYNERQAANVAVKQLVGEPLIAHIVLDGRPGKGPAQRHLAGLVTRVRFLRLENRRALYEAVIEPWLTLATRTSDYRIFQNQNVLDIVREVLGEYGLPFDVRATRKYPLREFQVQYGESDYDFVARLLHEWGLYFFFEHEEKSHKLVIVDDMTSHQPFAHSGYKVVPFHAAEATVREEHCDRFNACEELQSGRWVTDDFDFKRPKADLQQVSAMPRRTAQNTWERYGWPGDYVVESEGEQLVRTRMEEAGSRGERASGSGNLRAVVPGCLVTLERHPHNESNRQYLVTDARLRLQDVGDASSQQEFECRVDFEVIPASKVFRPPPPAVPRPRTTGPQTAIVTGPAGREIWTDEYGRVKLSFHWNRYCTRDENSSCWVRVSSPWAGTNFGGIQIPRIGQEVIVDFENGDPDRPIVTGRVYNADNMPPWKLPDNATQSGLLTRSSEGGSDSNANALRFEDKKGEEQVWLHAERNQDIEVEHDETHSVGRDRSKKVGRNQMVTIGMTYMHNVGLAKMVNIGLAYSFNVGMLRNTVVGMMDNTIVGKTQAAHVGEKYLLSVGGDKGSHIEMDGKTISLRVGASVMQLKADGSIAVTGKKINITAQGDDVTVNGNNIWLNPQGGQAALQPSAVPTPPPAEPADSPMSKLGALMQNPGSMLGQVSQLASVAQQVASMAGSGGGAASQVGQIIGAASAVAGRAGGPDGAARQVLRTATGPGGSQQGNA
ncbi:type VI secretion system secreted protein VgrG [Variovorax sp. TBS-050B]|uniref:type VI secretion system Vgr family protein n=1 Tax=Variovorax sp. TBS-050B TaxID=2940551 RepID=UPI00247629E1|nr:type VI secretion system tip protein TssI/VgrG [Variovorax sp. TBS-050B]MDH6590396.1 type VI secretion system secreted protein VgrG [Variovorax sp. TBS-050B]